MPPGLSCVRKWRQGDFGHGFVWIRLNIDFQRIRHAISDFAHEHKRYPESLSELRKFREVNLVDPWGNSYQYEKTPQGFKLLSLGRDGKPGGVGLDADIDSDPDQRIPYEPTLWQFLFEASGSRTLFWVATVASLAPVWRVIYQAGRVRDI